jgi:decaprenyl-phosphate phosphoribosyltransferase
MRTTSVAVIGTLRPAQYIKNLVVFAAPIGAAIDPSYENIIILVRAFICFCLVSSAGYVLNDWLDRKNDKFHETKKERPFAAGKLGKSHLIVLILTLTSVSTLIAWTLTPKFQATLLAYFILTSAYSIFLKQVPVVELVVVSLGFFIRALAGAFAFDVQASQWFLIVVGFSSLLLISVKRLSEFRKYGQNNTRMVMSHYSEQFLLTVVGLSITASMLGYTLWAFEVFDETSYAKLSIITLLIGMLRYLLHTENTDGEKPERAIFSDKLITLMGLITIILLLVAIYQK